MTKIVLEDGYKPLYELIPNKDDDWDGEGVNSESIKLVMEEQATT